MSAKLIAIDNDVVALQGNVRVRPGVFLDDVKPVLERALAQKYTDGVGEIHALMGQAMLELGRIDEAEVLLRITILEPTLSVDVRAKVLRILALAQRDRGAIDEGLRLLDEAIGLLYASTNKGLIALLVMNRGILLFRLGQGEKAFAEYRYSLRLYEELGDRSATAMCHQNIANVLRHMGKLEDAYRHASTSLQIKREEGNTDALYSIEAVRGRILLMLGDADNALKIGLMVRDHAIQQGLMRLEAEAEGHIANCYNQMEMFAKVLQHTQRSYELYYAMKNMSNARLAAANTASAMLYETGAREAKDYLSEQDELLAFRSDPGAVLFYYQSQGYIHQALHAFDEAIGYFTQACDASEANGKPLFVHDNLLNIALCYLEKNEAAQARDILMGILPEVEKVGWNRNLWLVYDALSQAEEHLGRLKKALMYARLRNTHRERAINEVSAQRAVAVTLQFEEQQRQREHDLLRTRVDVAEQASASLQQELHALTLRMLEHDRGVYDWSMFQVQFDKVHVGFMERLARICPELTTTELRVCTLMRMQMSTKHIASLLATSVRTVEGHRLRVRKKLVLGADGSLTTWLAAI